MSPQSASPTANLKRYTVSPFTLPDTRAVALSRTQNAAVTAPTHISRGDAHHRASVAHIFLHRLHWCSVWDVLVFCAFFSSLAVFLSALAGVGHVPPDTGAHAAPETLLRRFLSPSRVHTLEGAPWRLREDPDAEERVFFRPVSREAWYRSGSAVRPRLGAWVRSHRRMEVVRVPGATLPPGDQTQLRARRADLTLSPPLHERASQLPVSIVFPVSKVDHSNGEGGGGYD